MKNTKGILRKMIAMLLMGVMVATAVPTSILDASAPADVYAAEKEDNLSLSQTEDESTAQDELSEQTDENEDISESETLSDEEKDSTTEDVESDTEDISDELTTEDAELLEDDTEEALSEEVLTVENVGSSGTEERFVYTGFIAYDGINNYSAAVDGIIGRNEGCWKGSLQQGNGGTNIYIDFRAEEAIPVDGYILTTAYDLKSNSMSSNPKGWFLYGKLKPEDNWQIIDQKNIRLEDENSKEYSFDLDQAVTYQYFRFMIGLCSPQDQGGAYQVALDEFQLFVNADSANLRFATISGLQSSYYYTQKTITPTYTVISKDGTELKKGVDYTETISPSPVKGIGQYTLTVTGKGSYKGQQSVSFSVDAESYLSYTRDGASDGYWENSLFQFLFDNDKDTKWGTAFNGTKYVEFHSDEPINPVAYVLTTGDDTDIYPGRNPNSWRVLAKHNVGDAEWTVLHEVNNDTLLQGVSGKDYVYGIDNSQSWQYFRYEVSAVTEGDALQLAEFKFQIFKDPSDLANAVATGIKTSYTYTGETIDIDYILTAKDGTQLVKGTDYTETISPDPVKEIGSYTITLTGKGDYHGQKTIFFRVSKDRASLQGVKNGDIVYFPWSGIDDYSEWTVLSTEGDDAFPASGKDQALLAKIGEVDTVLRYYPDADRLLENQYGQTFWSNRNTRGYFFVGEDYAGLFTNFPEYDAIDNTSVTEEEGYSIDGVDYSPESFENRHFFSLSAREAAEYNKGQNCAENYWLRSSTSDGRRTWVCARALGKVSSNVNQGKNYALPAFNLDLDRIVYAEPEGTGYDYDVVYKNPIATNQMIHIPENPTDTWRLVFRDECLDVFDVTESSFVSLPGQTIQMHYDRAHCHIDGLNKDFEISALLYDSDGKLICYGRSGTISNGKGTVDFTLPGDLLAGDYTLCVINKECRELGALCNYASAPKEVNLTVLDRNSIVMPQAITGLEYSGEPQELVTAGQSGDLTLLYALTAKGASAPADNLYSSAIPKATDAGEYDIWVKVQGYDGTLGCVSTGIEKVDYTGVKTVSAFVPSNTATEEVDEIQLPALPEGASYESYGTIGGSHPELIYRNYECIVFTYGDENLLSYPGITSQPDGTSATITVHVSGARNYKDYNVVVTVTARDKDDAGAAIIGGDKTVTYGDATFTLAGTVTEAGTGTGVWKWTSSDASIAQIEENTGKVTIKGAGMANIKAEYVSDTTIGEASITLTVKRKIVAITGVTVSDKEYDGTKEAVIKTSGTVTGAITGDDVSIVAGTAVFDEKNIGNRTVSFSGFTLKGSGAGNYTLYTQPRNTTAMITQKPVTVSVTAVNRAYERGNTKVSLTGGDLAGVIAGDDVSADMTNVSGTIKDADAGDNKPVTVTGIVLSGNDAENYSLTQPSGVTVTISKASWTGSTTAEVTKTYRYTDENSEVYDMMTMLPESCGSVTFEEPVIFGSLTYKVNPAINNGKLTYTLAAGNAAEGTVTVTAHTQNYTDDFVLKINIKQQIVALFEKVGSDHEIRTLKELNEGKSFTLVPLFVDGGVVNKRVVWASTNPDVATVTQDGKVTAKAPGTTFIEVLSEEKPETIATCEVRVAEAVTTIKIDKSKVNLGTDESLVLTAQILPFTAGQTINWTVDKGDIISITPSDDTKSVTVKGLKAGSAKITATAADGSGKKTTGTVNVGNPVSDLTISGKGNVSSVAVGKTLAMVVDWGDKTNAPKNKEIKWSVAKPDGESAKDIAAISDKGVLTGISEGVVRVTATSAANPEKTKTADINVYVPIKSASLNCTSGTVSMGTGANDLNLAVNITPAIADMKATGTDIGTEPTVTWSVEDKYAQNLTVDTSTGVVKAGTVAGKNIPVKATITAFNGYSKTLTCKVTVTAANPLKGIKMSKTSLTMGEGNVASLTAILNPVNPDGSRNVIWTSSDPETVSVDAMGELTAKKPGSAVITATTVGTVAKGKNKAPEAVKATCKVTVKPSISTITFNKIDTLTDKGLNVGKSYTLKTAFALTGVGKAASTALRWTSSDPSVATVSNKGVVKAVTPGRVTITATAADKKALSNAPSASVTFDVYAAVKSIKLDKTKLNIGTQDGAQYGTICVAVVTPVDVTDPSLEWKTNNANVKLAAIGEGADPSLAIYSDAVGSGLSGTKKATGTGVTIGNGQSLAVMAVTPGVTKLTGITTDGSNKKVTCTVTIRGKVTGLSLKSKVADRNGYNDVTLSDDELTTDTVEYTGTMKAGSGMTLTPVSDINGISGSSTDMAEKNNYKAYQKYTDTSVSYRSSDTSILTVDNKGKISVKKNVSGTAIVYIKSADGLHKAEIKITVN